MPWEKPSIEEIAMSAEIGAYHDEFGGEDQRVLFPTSEDEDADDDSEAG